MKGNFLMIICFVFSSILSAQDKNIYGKVTDQEGTPLPGVNVIVDGTIKGSQTNFDGEFNMNVKRGGVLVFSYLGFKTQKIVINDQENIEVFLEEENSQLDEVVVVGYGTQKKSDISGSIATIDGDEIAERGTTNISNALQGAIAGVAVARNGSSPGSGNTIRIRGISTLEGDSSPLILVDDVPVASINDVNPDEVESISVLKDGASAAIYGSRAASGVVIITTKRAKAGVLSFQYSSDFTVYTPTRTPDPVGVIRYMEMENELAYNDGAADRFSQSSEEYINSYLANHKIDPDQFPNTDWKSLIVKKQSMGIRHGLTFTAGTEKVKTVGSFGFEKQDALYAHEEWKRYTGRINNDIKFTDKFGANFDVSYRVIKSSSPQINPLPSAYKYAPTYSAIYSDGRYADGKSGTNIYSALHQGGFIDAKQNRLYSKIGLYYKPTEDIKLSVNIAPSIRTSSNKSFRKQIPYWASDNHSNSGNPLGYGEGFGQTILYESRDEIFSSTNQLLADYNKNLGNHNFSVLGGYEEFVQQYENLAVKGIEYETSDYPYLSQAPLASVFDDGSSVSETAYRSVFGRLLYNYNETYFLQANVRRDGSSKFATDFRWGTFPSVSGAWLISNEKFMDPLKKTLSFMKLRASYGSLGNDRGLGDYLYASNLVFENVLFQEGNTVTAERSAAQRKLAIENITWETTTSLDLGVDLQMFDNRLALTFDYFIKETSDMLLDLSIPDLIGFEDPRFNVGSMDTKGWEFSVSWRDRIGDLNYGVNFNIDNYESIVGDIGDKRLFSGSTVSEEGQEYRTFYGYVSDGIYQTQEEVDNSPTLNSLVTVGDVKYKDISGPNGVPDGNITAEDRTYLGGSLPKLNYGGRLFLDYKGFDFSLSFQGIGERNSAISPSVVQPFQSNWFAPTALFDGNYWSIYNTNEQNAKAKYPRISHKANDNNYRFSDFWLIDGSYFRVKNITLGYTLKSDFVKNYGIESLRLSVAGNDLLSIDNFPDGWDPEQDSGSYLITKSYLLGARIKF